MRELLRSWTLLTLALLALAGAPQAAPITWRDAATGFAIGGYDPVAYFTRRKPVPGRPEHQLVWRGASWRFENQGNLDAFRRDPLTYAPRFAGYDATGVAEGRTVAGSPIIWALHDGRLYLFHDAVNRRLWTKDPEPQLAQALKCWEVLSRDLPVAPPES